MHTDRRLEKYSPQDPYELIVKYVCLESNVGMPYLKFALIYSV